MGCRRSWVQIPPARLKPLGNSRGFFISRICLCPVGVVQIYTLRVNPNTLIAFKGQSLTIPEWAAKTRHTVHYHPGEARHARPFRRRHALTRPVDKRYGRATRHPGGRRPSALPGVEASCVRPGVVSMEGRRPVLCPLLRPVGKQRRGGRVQAIRCASGPMGSPRSVRPTTARPSPISSWLTSTTRRSTTKRTAGALASFQSSAPHWPSFTNGREGCMCPTFTPSIWRGLAIRARGPQAGAVNRQRVHHAMQAHV